MPAGLDCHLNPPPNDEHMLCWVILQLWNIYCCMMSLSSLALLISQIENGAEEGSSQCEMDQLHTVHTEV